MDIDIGKFESVLRMGLVGNDITKIIESLKRCEIKADTAIFGLRVAVTDRLPEKGGEYLIIDEYGSDLALFSLKHKKWKSTDRPIPNACGKRVLRTDLYPTHWIEKA